ncbi:MAG: hypothetical protein KF873_21300 [Gemmataceae bacterium]|nr:hypothetical protein [Gemmataceae bacterium]
MLRKSILGALVAVGLFALAGNTAQADHWRRGPVVYRPVPVYRPVVPVAPVYALPTYGYGFNSFNSYYTTPGFSFGYSRGFYAPSYGWSYYGRPAVSFGFTTFR